MKRKLAFNLAALLFILLLPNCASIVSKSSYPVSINSNPTGASVSITDRSGIEIYNGKTPAYLTLKAGAGFFQSARYQLRFNLENHDESIVHITSSLDGWYFGNIFLGGLLGMLIVDPATGAMWRIDQQYINISLVPSNQQALNIININDLPEEYKQHLIRIEK